MAIFITSKAQLKKEDLNPYNIGSYIGTSESEFLSVEEVINNWEEHKNKRLYYFINWEDNNLYTESGQKIPAVYND